jgi:hypothetical protein
MARFPAIILTEKLIVHVLNADAMGMRICGNCREMVGSEMAFCSNCGANLRMNVDAQANQSAPKRTLPRIVGEQPASQGDTRFQQPPPQQPYQQYQPPVAPVYQPVSYAQRPQYQQPYPADSKSKLGAAGMALALVGGLMMMAGSMFLWYIDFGWGSSFSGVQDISNGDFLYSWLIPVFGLLALIFGTLAYAIQKKSMGAITTVFGLLGVIVTFIIPVHFSIETDTSLLDAFFISDGGSIFIYIGGFIAIIGGFLIMIGGSILVKKLTIVRRSLRQNRYR